MSIFENTYIKTRNYIKSVKEKDAIKGIYFEYAYPWIFSEILSNIRGENHSNIEKPKFLQYLKFIAYEYYLQIISYFSRNNLRNYDVLFWGSYSSHYKIYNTLELDLQENGLSYIYITDKIALYKEIKSENKNVVFLNINLTSKLKNTLMKSIKTNENIDLSIFNSINSKVKIFFRLYYLIKSTFEKVSPKIIITANEFLTEHRAAIIIGKELKIKSINLQHGLISNLSHLYKEMSSDLFLVYGNLTKNILLDFGINEERIKVVGSLLLGNQIINPKNIITKTSNLNVLVSMSGSGNSTSYQHHINIIEAINLVACKFSNINFNIKLHRKDKIEFYKNLNNKNINIINDNDLLKTNKTFIDLVNENDAMITTTSASMFDAFLLKKPVLGIDFYAEFKENEFYKEGLLIISENVVDLENNLKNLKEKPEIFEPIINKANRFLEEYYNLGCSNDTPQKKTVNQIINLIKE